MLVLLVISFATLVTTHVVIAARLVWRVRPRYRGLVALLLPPMAPVWAWGQRWARLVSLWIGSLLAYVVALVIASL